MNKTLIASLLVTATSLCSFSSIAALTPFQKDVLKVMKMEHRNAADKERDDNRVPYQALAFFGLEKDMKVIEFAPGNGWYSKILAPLLKDDGELHLAYKKEWLEGMNDTLAIDVMSKAKKLPIELDWNPEARSYKLGTIDFGMADADMMLSIREYHNFNLEDKTKLNKATFDALKPGGTYVIVDHSRRHMMPETDEMRRREDPIDVILEVQAAGFVLEKSSKMFYRPDDELRYEVGRKSVTGNTDRFTLVFKKPK
ncbi:class I SAM-dependent methyltransferase [Shewanella sp. 6_MG-2023]|uniref:class I SAM-dependent methyltransferase n=1 Tax=Shewanella sp. 6_MG-2023 TaxID=3062660 RepID=UPI0026E1910B|nr:methyltransferase [Shewanella sp. 6_MG-2023]MDO6618561.1 methyltransferase [Shewanella sp. 6_MG-2023]